MISFPIARTRRTVVGVAVLVGGVLAVVGALLASAPRDVHWLVLLVSALPVGLMLITARGAFATRFVVEPDSVAVRGDLYAHDVRRAALRMDAARRVALRGADAGLVPRLRTLGTGLPGYAAGWFVLADGRDAYVSLTDWDKAVVVPSRDDLLLLSPENPDAFLAALGAAAQPVPLDEVAPVLPSRGRRWLVAMVVLVSLTAAGLLGVSFAAPWRATTHVTTTGDLVLSGDLWARTIPAAAIDAARVGVADLSGADAALAPTWRTAGTSVPGWSAGWFRRADGGSAFLWLRTGEPVVVVPTRDGYVVLVSAAEPAALVAALRAR